MGDWLFYIFCVVSLAIGWCLGYYSRPKPKESKPAIHYSGDMKHRLQLLFDSYSDETIERFIQSLDVTAETLSLHISIGKHFRIQGEVEKAILIHQNLMSHPELSSKSSEHIIYELAKDYKAAGLFDRAQALLHQLKNSKQFSVKSLKLLLDIHEAEKDWITALSEASRLDLKRYRDMALRVSQYYCEIADDYLKENLLREAISNYREALSTYKGCFRAHLGLAKIYCNSGDYANTIHQLKLMIALSPENIKLALPLLLKATKATDSFENHQQYLIKLLNDTGQTPIVLAIIESMLEEGYSNKAGDFLFRHLKEQPSLVGLDSFFKLDSVASYAPEEVLTLVSKVLDSIHLDKNDYQCISCGFAGTHLHWLCPSCKSWQTMRPQIDFEKTTLKEKVVH